MAISTAGVHHPQNNGTGGNQRRDSFNTMPQKVVQTAGYTPVPAPPPQQFYMMTPPNGLKLTLGLQSYS
jgi:hypothetical protein